MSFTNPPRTDRTPIVRTCSSEAKQRRLGHVFANVFITKEFLLKVPAGTTNFQSIHQFLEHLFPLEGNQMVAANPDLGQDLSDIQTCQSAVGCRFMKIYRNPSCSHLSGLLH